MAGGDSKAMAQNQTIGMTRDEKID